AEFLAREAPRPGLAWDAGCGSGQLSVLLAEAFERVVATDGSAEQLARAAPHPKVEYRRAAAESSGLPDASVDLAVAAQAAHWFDLPAYYAEVRRVAKKGALVAQTVYNLVEVDDAIDLVVRRFYADKLQRYWPPERRHVEQDYATLPFPFERVAAPKLEMRATWTLRHFLGYMRSWSGVVAMEKALGPEPLGALERELEALWGPEGSARAVSWPLTLRVGRI
ncbi:MAG TPA: class I SAM-dependent methyltransferase, partial [Gemmatimonadales bacterium]|nr:class I SAM-dependent methyltransferase [Gemmatimonadales bacterium]